MYNKTTTVVIAAVIFALAGTLVLASFSPHLFEEVNATKFVPDKPGKPCNENSPDGQDGSDNDALKKGCGDNDEH